MRVLPFVLLLGCSSSSYASPDAGVVHAPSRRGEDVLADVARVPGAMALLEGGIPALAKSSDQPIEITFPRGTLSLGFIGRAVAPSVHGTTVAWPDVMPGVDMLLRKGAHDVEQLHVVREHQATITLRHRVTLSGSLARLEARGDRVLVLDDRGAVQGQTAPAFAIDADGRRRAVHFELEGDVLVETLDASGLTAPIVIDPRWLVLTAPKYARSYGAAVRVGDVIYVLDGTDDTSPVPSIEAYDSKTDTWTIKTPRSYGTNGASIVDLADGRILVAGGNNAGWQKTAEIYDPKTDKWTATGAMAVGRSGATALRLASGDVLVTGGGSPFDRADHQSTAELYETAKGTFKAVAPMKNKHGMRHRSFELSTGKVLVVGGGANAELWDPKANTWTEVTGAPTWLGASSTMLASGKVLAAGGMEGTDWIAATKYSAAALFDPTTEKWTATGALPVARGHGDLVRFGDKAVLFGGIIPGGELELHTSMTSTFDESTGTWSAGDRLVTPHAFGAVTTLSSGAIFITSGIVAKMRAFANAEIYGRTNGESCDTNNLCVSGVCVDGVCCNKVCDGQCEACDIPGGLGRCWPVTGKPHGKRVACSDGAGDACKAMACDGLVDRTACAVFANGLSTSCGAAKCDGASFVGAGHCDGKGACVSPLPSACTPFACATSGCLSTCTVDKDCAPTFRCDGGACKPIDATCSADLLVSQPRNGGVPVACAPYKCNADNGTCRSKCQSTDECSPGSACDVGAGTCTPLSSVQGSDEGSSCAYGHGQTSTVFLACLGLLALARRRR